MQTVKVSTATVAQAGNLLRTGGLVAFPTETVYGLGANACDGRAVAAIFAAKGRPNFNPLIVHVVDLEAAERLAVLSEDALRLAAVFWPGPLTLVLPRRPDCGLSELVSAGLDTVGIRVPDHPIAQALLRAAGVPVAAPSANRSGHVSATTAEHVAIDFPNGAEKTASGRHFAPDMILDGGPTAHGVESTVLDASGAEIRLLRPGAVLAEAIEAVLGHPLQRATAGGDRPVSPGQLASHYAPNAQVRLNAHQLNEGEALLAFGPRPIRTRAAMINLSPTGDLVEAAASLFAALRALDATGAQTIAVMQIPAIGLGEAINDRLHRAAALR
jgi:L-threonylcarbamoyladenylate synthase